MKKFEYSLADFYSVYWSDSRRSFSAKKRFSTSPREINLDICKYKRKCVAIHSIGVCLRGQMPTPVFDRFGQNKKQVKLEN